MPRYKLAQDNLMGRKKTVNIPRRRASRLRKLTSSRKPLGKTGGWSKIVSQYTPEQVAIINEYEAAGKPIGTTEKGISMLPQTPSQTPSGVMPQIRPPATGITPPQGAAVSAQPAPRQKPSGVGRSRRRGQVQKLIQKSGGFKKFRNKAYGGGYEQGDLVTALRTARSASKRNNPSLDQSELVQKALARRKTLLAQRSKALGRLRGRKPTPKGLKLPGRPR